MTQIIWMDNLAPDVQEEILFLPNTVKEQEQLRWCIKRGCPFGDEGWVETTARRLDLESTMRPRGRPKKFPNSR